MAKPSNPTTKKIAAKRRAPEPNASAAVPASGPITLSQARALAAMAAKPAKPRVLRQVLGAQPALVPAPAEGPSPDAVAVERRKLKIEQREERNKRIRDYKATLLIMKKRGLKGLQAQTDTNGPGAKPSATTIAKPLQILAEGDSWFDYPVPFFGGSIVPRLEDLLGVPILNMAKAGDEVRFMLGVEERKLLSERLSAGCPAGGPWDLLLFSGGGNDIVANPMALWIKDYDAQVTPAEHVHTARFKAAMALVLAGYEDLIETRNRLSPNTHVIFHGYDFPIPDGRGVCHLGPWLKPTFDFRRFPSVEFAAQVVQAMLEQFTVALQRLHRPAQGVTFLNTQGTLLPQASSWHNELHPSKAGFNQFAKLFQAKIKQLFPASVL